MVIDRYACFVITRSVYSVERAAAMIGVSHVTLRSWAKKGEPEDAKPVLFLNERQPVYTKEQIDRLRKERGNQPLT